MAVDLDVVHHALTVARQRNYATVELEAPGLSFSADLAKGHVIPTPKVEESVATVDEAGLRIIRSQLVGFFGIGPKKVKPGSKVTEDDIVGVITALGIPNEVVAGVNGVVDEVMVKDGEGVEFGQALMKVNPE